MRIIFYGAIVFILFNSVYTECDNQIEKTIKQCYKKFYTALNITILTETKTVVYPTLGKTGDKKVCKIFEEKEKCLGKDDEHCLNVEKFSKIMGVSDAEAVKFLLFDFTSQYTCKNGFKKDYKPTEDAVDCEVSINFTDECPLTGKGCKMAKNLFECYKHVLEYKCNDKKWLEFRTKTWKYAMERTWSLCHF